MPPPPVVRASRAKCSVAVDIEEDETEESVPLDILAKGTIIFNNDGALGERELLEKQSQCALVPARGGRIHSDPARIKPIKPWDGRRGASAARGARGLHGARCRSRVD